MCSSEPYTAQSPQVTEASVKVKCFPEMQRGAEKLSIKQEEEASCMADHSRWSILMTAAKSL